ncbi:hypothetical protein A1O7_04661 [Cladophialophora yegresii CBS 114405]|uniref:Uncharacterized protein n=1 Tax=Cladophialophora yegresii CBS 114405 TaxID=1182544 RepID=W9VXW6_9EURO|nr:uncharacterized protein A1O7_04661 [Cladophialophora yegresii CBS 114405]EXJ60508.1 hypothetical protein A1O7_04661 [Cladophialophora yegresii CBS 114405]
MSAPVAPRRPRGRPRKNPRPTLPGLVTYEFNTLADPCMTLRYNPGKKCLCTYKTTVKIGDSLCPYHGYYDDKSKTLSRTETASTPLTNKRKRDVYEKEEQDHGPQLSLGLAVADKPQVIRRVSPQTDAEERFNVGLCLIKEQAQQLLDDGSLLDRHPHASTSSQSGPLLKIDFLRAPLEARKLIYRYLLVPSSRSITFPSQQGGDTFSELNPELQTNILFTHPFIYNECRPILYGESTFVARSATDFFLPTGIQGLRPATARRIKHIAIVRIGTANECDITSHALASSLHSMVLQSPAFLGLRSVTLRFEVNRPVHLNLFTLQMYLNRHGVTADVRAMYKKAQVVKDAAAKVAFKALQKGSPFQGLCLVEESEHTTWGPGGVPSRTVDVNEVCLFRTREAGHTYEEEKQTLQGVITDMLLDEILYDVPGAVGRYWWFCRKCPT